MDERKAPSSDVGKICPYCAELIRAAAIKCRYCLEFLDKPTSTESPPQPAAPLQSIRNPDENTAHLERVEWLVGFLNLENRKQAYAMISDGRIPPKCIHRAGRYLRVKTKEIQEWVNSGS